MTILGMDQLNRQMATLRRAGAPAMASAVDQAAGVIVARMKALVPKRTGKLAASIVSGRGQVGKYAYLRGGSSRAAGDDTVFITAGNSAARHAALVEFGTKPHSLAKGANLKKNRYQNRTPKHPGAQKRPFFFVAYRAEKRRAQTIMRAETRRQVLAAVRGGATRMAA